MRKLSALSLAACGLLALSLAVAPAGVALRGAACPPGALPYAIVPPPDGPDPAGAETVRRSLRAWIGGLPLVPVETPVVGAARVVFLLGDDAAGIYADGTCGTEWGASAAFVHLPRAPADVTVLHECGHALFGLQHPSRVRAYSPRQQADIYRGFADVYEWDGTTTYAQVLAPLPPGSPLVLTPDGPSIMDIDFVHGLPSGAITVTDRATAALAVQAATPAAPTPARKIPAKKKVPQKKRRPGR